MTHNAERYARNLLIPGIGQQGQDRLFRARVLIVGLGGLGSPAAFYLTAAGIGTLGILDSDVVEPSNLNRQIAHTADRIGWTKTESMRQTLLAFRPDMQLELHTCRLTVDNAQPLIAPYDAVVEACDTFDAKYLINDACVALRKPFVTAGILALSGQAMLVVPGQTPCLRCLFPNPPEGVPTTSELGVLGAVPGALGSIEALELVRWLTGLWKPNPEQAGALHHLDGDRMRLHTTRIYRRADCLCAANTMEVNEQ